jgi:hypothetical protein
MTRLAHKSPRPLPTGLAAFSRSRSLRFPLLACCAIVGAGATFKLVAVQYATDVITERQARKDARLREQLEREAEIWRRSVAGVTGATTAAAAME